MKTVAPLLALIGILLICSSDGVTPPRMYKCCSEISQQGIPINTVASAQYTSKNCRLHALIVSNKMGRKFCIDPQSQWVRRNQHTLSKIMNSS
ncbi:eotaxin-like [Periophthalmus magnuspinnatus]|uniref:eotaxin-like n=1 Tax=Periophthalmus magnuspinnatus TaxID=409849 RepID=UPI00145AD5F3|nr:eotaxin-like [Periophthalmus magnuspinnatus]XP_033847590.1 eotaxin-like [Periophthalmus magnuspinnatus]